MVGCEFLRPPLRRLNPKHHQNPLDDFFPGSNSPSRGNPHSAHASRHFTPCFLQLQRLFPHLFSSFFLHLQRIKLRTEAVSLRSESSRCFHRTNCKWQRKLWKWIAHGVGGNTRGSNLEHFARISQNFEYRRLGRSAPKSPSPYWKDVNCTPSCPISSGELDSPICRVITCSFADLFTF